MLDLIAVPGGGPTPAAHGNSRAARREALSFGHASAQRDRRGRRPAGDGDQPGQGLLPRPGLHQARPGGLLPGRGRRRAAWRGRAADGPEALRQRRRGRVLLPEAGARIAARVGSDGRDLVPVRPNRRRSRDRRRGRAGSGSPTSAAWTSTRTRSGPTTWTTPTSCAWTWIRCPACPGTTSAGSRVVVAARCWPTTGWSAGPRPPARAASTSTSGSSARWSFDQVRRAALALAREVERRAPALATSKWWKEERHGVFIDYNQNAKDRTVASAYSVRPVPNAQVSAPVTWDELPAIELADFTLATVPARFAADRRSGGRDGRGGGLARRAAGAVGAAGEVGAGGRALAAQLRQGRRTSRRASRRRGRARSIRSRAAAGKPAAGKPRRRPASPTGRPPRPPSRSSRSPGPPPRKRRWPVSSAGRRATSTSSPTSSRPTCSSIRCAAAPLSGTASASTWSTCRRSCGRRRNPSTSDYDPWTEMRHSG